MTTIEAANLIIACFKKGGKLLICGCGGSATMSDHMAAEFICKFEHERDPLPAIALSTSIASLTAISNDFDFKYVFQRQVFALGKEGDILITFSTSGKSKSVLKAIKQAYANKMTVIEAPRNDTTTAHIQESQLEWLHDVCRLVEKAFI